MAGIDKETMKETMKAAASGPIDAIFARKNDILAMKHEDVEKMSKLLSSVAWCGGLGCGHGGEALRAIPEITE